MDLLKLHEVSSFAFPRNGKESLQKWGSACGASSASKVNDL